MAESFRGLGISAIDEISLRLMAQEKMYTQNDTDYQYFKFEMKSVEKVK